jgi:hypothetical protein
MMKRTILFAIFSVFAAGLGVCCQKSFTPGTLCLESGN